MDAQQIEQQYGLSRARAETVMTADGPIHGTLVPITLANGQQGQLFIPQAAAHDAPAVYRRDEQGLHPIQLKDNVRRDELTRAPAIVETRAEPAHSNKRSWEKEALMIRRSAGAGTVLGAAAGGNKAGASARRRAAAAA
jgi:hypothetical protein